MVEPEASHYGYCKGDPWNRADPSGALGPLLAGIALVGIRLVTFVAPKLPAIARAVKTVANAVVRKAPTVVNTAKKTPSSSAVVKKAVQQTKPVCVQCAQKTSSVSSTAKAKLTPKTAAKPAPKPTPKPAPKPAQNFRPLANPPKTPKTPTIPKNNVSEPTKNGNGTVFRPPGHLRECRHNPSDEADGTL